MPAQSRQGVNFVSPLGFAVVDAQATQPDGKLLIAGEFNTVGNEAQLRVVITSRTVRIPVVG